MYLRVLTIAHRLWRYSFQFWPFVLVATEVVSLIARNKRTGELIFMTGLLYALVMLAFEVHHLLKEARPVDAGRR